MLFIRMLLLVWFLVGIPARAQDELPPGIPPTPVPPAPPFAPTFTLHVCQSGEDYLFSYETEQDIYAAESFLSGVDEPLHWGALFVLYAEPEQRSTFIVPISAVINVELFGPAQWTVMVSPHEQQTVTVDHSLTACQSEPVAQPAPVTIGQRVIFLDEYQQQRQGVIIRYLYQHQLAFPLIRMDDLMYVIEYGEPSQRVLNRSDFVVISQ